MIDSTTHDFVRPVKVDVSYFTHAEMVVFAAKRNRVELSDGRGATLIRWTTPRRTSTVRVQFYTGNFLTVKKAQVTAVLVEPLQQQEATA